MTVAIVARGVIFDGSWRRQFRPTCHPVDRLRPGDTVDLDDDDIARLTRPGVLVDPNFEVVLFAAAQPADRSDVMIGHSHRNGELVACEGTIVGVLAASNFRVLLDNGQEVTCRPCGRMQLHKIAIVCGDRVAIEVAAANIARGRVVFRFGGDKPVARPRHRRKGREGRSRSENADSALD